MLVLARKKAETILIGGDIVIKVLQMRNGVVRIGIDAPSSVRVMRGELRNGLELEANHHADPPAPATHNPQAIPGAVSTEVAAREEQGSPVLMAASLPKIGLVGPVQSPVAVAAPLAAVLRELRVVPNGASGPPLQLRSSQRN